MTIEEIPFDRNKLVEMVGKVYQEHFDKKWTGHVCDIAGCKRVIVLDGNMKNAREVCACNNVGELFFSGMEGSIVVGCQNTPKKGSRYCVEHENLSSPFIDDSCLLTSEKRSVAELPQIDLRKEILPVKIMNEKETRQGKFYQVLWSDGKESWAKEANLPMKVLAILKLGNGYSQTKVKVEDSGFGAIELESVNGDGNALGAIDCGTEKGKHKCKNFRTAGILVFERPCGVVIGIRELFGSESKTQVYGHLHALIDKGKMDELGTICYDDACHLKRFAMNPKRCSLTPTATLISTRDIVCDRFHFRNHIDKWCKKHCNPDQCNDLKAS
ncbi:Hypothetical predicted protein [Paramuricea clavata]|uniref:Uncharacterized protein n=1 Tax=Paramuricea clavata TaxID=317549 RepID=A0A6S7HQF5_PARCT|nr:Hypothetical predicted protein [Paramuricea clavata]